MVKHKSKKAHSNRETKEIKETPEDLKEEEMIEVEAVENERKEVPAIFNIPKSVWIIVSVLFISFFSAIVNLNNHAVTHLFNLQLLGVMSVLYLGTIIALLGFLIYALFFYRKKITYYILVLYFAFEVSNLTVTLFDLIKHHLILIESYWVLLYIFSITVFINSLYLKEYLSKDSNKSNETNEKISPSSRKKSKKLDTIFFYTEIILIILAFTMIVVEIFNTNSKIMKYENTTRELSINAGLNFCNKLSNSYDRGLCFTSLLYTKINNTNISTDKLVTICQNITNRESVFIDKNGCLKTIANKRNSPNTCALISLSNNSKETKDLQQYCLATTSKDISLCNNIADESIRKICMNEIKK